MRSCVSGNSVLLSYSCYFCPEFYLCFARYNTAKLYDFLERVSWALLFTVQWWVYPTNVIGIVVRVTVYAVPCKRAQRTLFLLLLGIPVFFHILRVKFIKLLENYVSISSINISSSEKRNLSLNRSGHVIYRLITVNTAVFYSNKEAHGNALCIVVAAVHSVLFRKYSTCLECINKKRLV